MLRAWTLTDGDPVVETRCLGVAEAVADRVERRRVSPRAPWRWLAPLGPIDPREAADAAASPIAPRRGWPDVVVAGGRRAVPYLAAIKTASKSRVVTVLIGETLAGARAADVVAVAEPSRLEGPNVVRTIVGPHRLDPVRLAAARGGPAPGPADAGGPRIGVLLGGARRRRWSGEDHERLAAGLATLSADGASLLVASRRDGPAEPDLAAIGGAHYVWDRSGPDPRAAIIAHAQALVVAGDDALATDEALAGGLPVYAFRPGGLGAAEGGRLDRLAAQGLLRPFAGRLDAYSATPADAASEIARAIAALVATREALRPRTERRAATRSRETNGPTTR